MLPRAQTRHLDGEPELVVKEWVARWSNSNKIQKLTFDLSPLPKSWNTLIVNAPGTHGYHLLSPNIILPHHPQQLPQ